MNTALTVLSVLIGRFPLAALAVFLNRPAAAILVMLLSEVMILALVLRGSSNPRLSRALSA
jgi:hypothetical protein